MCLSVISLVYFFMLLVSNLADRFRPDAYKYRNYHYRKYATNKLNIVLGNILEAHPTDKDVMQKAASLEKFLVEMPDPSVNGGYKQMLREQRKQGEQMDFQMKNARNEMRDKTFNKIMDNNGRIGDEEGKLLKQILESRGKGNVRDGKYLGVDHIMNSAGL